MKFKKESQETKEYQKGLSAYINILDGFTSQANKFFDEHPDFDDDESQELKEIQLSILKHKKEMESFYESINLGKEVRDNFIAMMMAQSEELRKSVSALSEKINDRIDVIASKNKINAFEGALNILDGFDGQLKTSFESLAVVPAGALDSGSVKAENQPVVNAAAVNKYRQQYINEFVRLAKELKATDPWYSRGSKSYQALENYLVEAAAVLKKTGPKDFAATFANVMKNVNIRASNYEITHRMKNLDSRQMKRLKIMNRFYMLGENMKNPDVNPEMDYQRKIAEKYIHATAIHNLGKNPKDGDSDKLLRNPKLLKAAVDDLLKDRAFLNSIPRSKEVLFIKVQTNGEKLRKSLSVRIKEAQEDIKLQQSLKEKDSQITELKKFFDNLATEPQPVINNQQNTLPKNQNPVVPGDLTDEEILAYEQQFAQIDQKPVVSGDLTDEEILAYEKQFARLYQKPVYQQSLSPAAKRQQRLQKNPENGLDWVLNDPEMQALETQMLMGDEFNNTLPAKLRYCNSVEVLENFKKVNGAKLSKEEKQYIDNHIATEKFYSKLEKNRIDYEPKGPVQRVDGTIILEHIHLDAFQNSDNGCYSCSEMLLLQSRGLYLDQRQIRNYRLEGSMDHLTPEEKERTQGDNMGNIVDIGGIATRCLKNTAVRERTYSSIDTASNATKQKIALDVRKSVKEALTVHRSPISLLRDGHYITIVGYNEAKDTFIYKNSMTDRDSYEKMANNPYYQPSPDDEHEMGMNELLNVRKLAIGYYITVDPENPMKDFKDGPQFEYVDGQFQENNAAMMGTHKDADNPDGKLIWNMELIGDGVNDHCSVQSLTKVPKRLDLTLEMERRIGDKFKIKPLKDSPDKQALMTQISNLEKNYFPDKNVNITISGKYDGVEKKWKNLSFKCGNKVISNDQVMDYMYLQRLKANIDILTPWQVKHAFAPERFKHARENIERADAFDTFMALTGKTVSLKTLEGDFMQRNKAVQTEPKKEINQINLA